MNALIALAAALIVQSPDDGPIRTGGTAAESAESVRVREAIASPIPCRPARPPTTTP